MAIIRECEHDIERSGEFPGERFWNLEAEVMPAFGDAIALVFRRDIESADECDPVIDHERFAVIAKTKAFQFERIEPSEFAASLYQRIAARRYCILPQGQ